MNCRYPVQLHFIKILLLVLGIGAGAASAQQARVKQAMPVVNQLKWHDLEYYWFIHFGPNTFTNKEWGEGDEPAEAFNPTELDCRQWARIAKQSGAKGIIITAKHHDGFCLWPSQFSKHTVKQSSWKNGKGDVLKELRDACKKEGLLFGVYLSPWDRNHPQYGTAAYNNVYMQTMKELVRRYGPFFEFWWDGANGEGPNGKKQVYYFRAFEKTMRSVAPNTLLFSDIGPDIRWVGNEQGIAGKTNWNYLDTAGFKRGLGAPPTDTLNQGNMFGKHWIPSECDVSIRPGWFYHEEEDTKVKTGAQLFDLYLKSVGRGSNLLLNVPPDRRGLIHPADSAALVEFRQLKEKNFSNNLASDARAELHYNMAVYESKRLTDNNLTTAQKINDYKRGSFWVKFGKETAVNCVLLGEYLKEGQHIAGGKIVLLSGASVIQEIPFTTVGRKRILTFPVQTVTAMRVVITDAKGKVSLSEIQAYRIDDNLIEK